MNNIKFETSDGKKYSGEVLFTKKGGTVSIQEDGELVTYHFDSRRVSDEGNFLVTFLHRMGYDKPTIKYKRKSYTYIEPEHTRRTFPYIDETILQYIYQDGKVFEYNANASLASMVLELNDANVTVEYFLRNSVFKTNYAFCKNLAINEILNYNNVTPEYIKKHPKLIYVMHEYVLKGHTTINTELSGTKWRVSNTSARLSNKSEASRSNNVFIIP